MPARPEGVIIALVVAMAAAAYLLARDELAPVHGDVIAYSCKERKSAWYAICVMRRDGTEKQRVTCGSPRPTSPGPDGRRITLTRNEDVGESTTVTDDDVFVMDADGSGLRQLTPERSGRSSGEPVDAERGR